MWWSLFWLVNLLRCLKTSVLKSVRSWCIVRGEENTLFQILTKSCVLIALKWKTKLWALQTWEFRAEKAMNFLVKHQCQLPVNQKHLMCSRPITLHLIGKPLQWYAWRSLGGCFSFTKLINLICFGELCYNSGKLWATNLYLDFVLHSVTNIRKNRGFFSLSLLQEIIHLDKRNIISHLFFWNFFYF